MTYNQHLPAETVVTETTVTKHRAYVRDPYTESKKKYEVRSRRDKVQLTAQDIIEFGERLSRLKPPVSARITAERVDGEVVRLSTEWEEITNVGGNAE